MQKKGQNHSVHNLASMLLGDQEEDRYAGKHSE
jgi:hypothetical protein